MLHASVHDAPTARRHRFARKRMKRVVDCLFTRQNPGAMSLSRQARAKPILHRRGFERSFAPAPADVSSIRSISSISSTGEGRPADSGRLAENLLRFDLIVIDELGYLPFSQSGGHLLFHMISKLYESTSLIITTNLAFADWPPFSATPK